MTHTKEIENLNNWLVKQNEKPILHVNGRDCPTALVTVDFGSIEFSLDETREHTLRELLIEAGGSIARSATIGTSKDKHHNIYWANIIR